jgi:hypothetical protein
MVVDEAIDMVDIGKVVVIVNGSCQLHSQAMGKTCPSDRIGSPIFHLLDVVLDILYFPMYKGFNAYLLMHVPIYIWATTLIMNTSTTIHNFLSKPD